MLPPVSGPAMPLKSAPSAVETAQGSQTGPRASTSALAAEGGPAKLRPETLRAIDPSRQSEPIARVTRDGLEQSDTRPAGPPPAFVETLLERQARVALDPPETGPAPEVEPQGVPRDLQAEAGFAETRALGIEAEAPVVDRKE